MTERVAISVTDGVADVRLTRGDKMNALDLPMFEAIAAAIFRLRSEPGLRAVVLSGEGRSFCAGLDMNRMKDGGKRDHEPRTHGLANLSQQAAWGWRELQVPVLAAVHGVAFGGGFQIALGADLRFVAPDTKMSVMEIKWGLIPDMAGTLLMARLVRDDILRDLVFTGRVFSAQEAQSYGLATRICEDPRQAALEAAREMAEKNPDAIRAAKRILNGLSPDAARALLAESVEIMKLIGQPNQLEAVRANFDKRKALFADSH